MGYRIRQWEKQFAGTTDQSMVEAMGIQRGVYSGVGSRAAWLKGDAAGASFDEAQGGKTWQSKLTKAIDEFTQSFGGIEAEYDMMIDNAKINVGQATVNITTAAKESVTDLSKRETSFEDFMIAGSNMTSIPGMQGVGLLSEIMLAIMKLVKEGTPGQSYNPDNNLPNNSGERDGTN